MTAKPDDKLSEPEYRLTVDQQIRLAVFQTVIPRLEFTGSSAPHKLMLGWSHWIKTGEIDFDKFQ